MISNKVIENKSLIATTDLKAGEILFQLDGEIVNHPTRTSVQIDENKHLECPNIMITNHSCQPNSYIDYKNHVFKTNKKIKKGEEITFNYITTEWDMSCPFECECKTKECFGSIKGLKYINEKNKNLVFYSLPNYLKKKLFQNNVQ